MPADPFLGTVVGRRYRVTRLLGSGASGRVYEAEHIVLGRRVALKLLDAELANDQALRARFLREPQMAAAIKHPSIIPVQDVDDDDGQLFIVMDLIEGADLRAILRQGPLDPQRAISIVRQAAAGIDAAHSVGLIHRDVKPANILVGPGDAVVLTDFGLAKNSRAAGNLTVTGRFFGTLAYAAPEQFETRGAGPATDRYALGCVLWECLTGEVPFRGDSDLQVMRAHLESPPPKVGGELPATLDAVFATALAKNPEARYESAGAMVEAARSAFSAPVADRPRRAMLGAPALVRPESGGVASRAVRRLGSPIGAALIVPLALAGGLAAGTLRGQVKHVVRTETTSRPAPIPRVVRASGIFLKTPHSWKLEASPPSLARLGLVARIAIAAQGSVRGRLVVATPQSGRSAIPARLRSALGSTAQAVQIGPYQALLFGPKDHEVAYAEATDRGYVILVCSQRGGLTGPFASECERTASTVRMNGRHAQPLLPSKGDATAIRSALTRSTRARSIQRVRLASAVRAIQGAAASSIAAAYARSATTIARLKRALVTTGTRPPVVAALRAEAVAFTGLANAANAGSAPDWTAAASRVRVADRRLKSALSALDRATARPGSS